MALALKDLNVLAYANGFTLWHYKTNDDADVVSGDGYFLKAGLMLRAGDMIMATTEFNGAPKAGIFSVETASSATVDLRDMASPGVNALEAPGVVGD